MDLITVKGKIIRVKDKYITILDAKNKNEIECFYDSSYWYKPGKVKYKKLFKGDTVYAKLMLDSKSNSINTTHKFAREPLVIIGSDLTTLKQSIGDALQTQQPGHYYNMLTTQAKKHKITVEKYLDEWADAKLRRRDFSYTTPKGIEEDKIKSLTRWWFYYRLIRKFNLLDIKSNDIVYIDDSLHQLYLNALKNPFSVLSIPVERCMAIFEMLYKTPTDEQIVCARIARKLHRYMLDLNHNCAPVTFFQKALPNFDRYLTLLEKDYRIKVDSDYLYLPYPLKVEKSVSYYLNRCLNYQFNFKMKKIEYTRNDLNEDQTKSIETALNNNVTIITGGAGTGKTTVIKEIVHNLSRARIKFVLSSFTGKAVSRLKEITQIQNIATLDFNIRSLNHQFEYILIDEASMVSTELFYRFIKSNPYASRIVLIGDTNQLPPISWGSLFLQMFETEVKVCRLTQNHRSDVLGENGIIHNSELIINYQPGNEIKFKQFHNFRITEGGENKVITLVNLFKKQFGNVFTLNQNEQPTLKVICPYDFPLESLNNKIRSLFLKNNSKSIKDTSSKLWYEGGSVMLTENKNKIGIMNGDEGVIEEINYWNSTVMVQFYNGIRTNFDIKVHSNAITHMVETGVKDQCCTDMLIQSYAISIHKSQGSEWEYVILYVPKTKNSNQFIDSRLLYTAMTRARKAIWCIGDAGTLAEFAKIPLKPRYDCLSKRIKVK